VTSTHLQDVILVEFRAAVLAPLCLPISTLPVGYVLLLGSSFEMARITASGIVAFVSDNFRLLAGLQEVGYAMGLSLLAV